MRFSIAKKEIELAFYSKHVVRYTVCSRVAFVVAFIYILNLSIALLNMHRLLITVTVLSAKHFNDFCNSNAYYGRVGVIATVIKLNRLELQVLSLFLFNIFMSPQDYENFFTSSRKEQSSYCLIKWRASIPDLQPWRDEAHYIVNILSVSKEDTCTRFVSRKQ